MAGTGTGTPSVAGTGTVQSILEYLQYRRDLQVNGDDLIHVVNMAIRTIAKRLYTHGSDIITGALSVSIVADTEDAYGDLPADFWGLNGKPYLSGHTYPLRPLPSHDVALTYSSTGTPIYYKVKGLKIYVIPETSADCTICGDYFQKPAAVTATTSAVPFNELFDDLICEYAEQYFRGFGSEKGGVSIDILDKMVREQVDLVALKYGNIAPPQFGEGTDWDLK